MRLNRLFAAVLIACAALPLLAAAANTPSIRDWINSPEAYFLTTEERNQWDLTVTSDEKAKEFIEQYWQKRGPAFKRDVMSRVEFADANFGFAGIAGSRTPRGRLR